ncbi:MAG TPA: EAL domain-containing protein [Acidobacteriaceae bacterium]|nr:EAL domain-containing protein [Acidobacteriaceae bacterium]
MAQLVEFFDHNRVASTPALPRGDLPQQLSRLLLTSHSVSELYSRLGEFLLQSVALDGMWLGSPDESEQVQYHYSAGDGVAEFLDTETISLDENVNSPLARAWRTGTPQFASDWTDPSNHLPGAFWRERGLRFGWRSSCAIPITGESEKRDILILYSKRPKFFARDYIRRFVLQLHSLLGFALERLRLIDAMEQSRRTLALYKQAMDVSSQGIVIAKAGDDLPISYANRAFERLTGYTAEEAIGRNCRFLQGEDTTQPETQALRDALRKGQPCTVELRNYRKNGTMFWNSVSVAPVVDEDGRATHFIGIQKDVTYQKTLLSESVHLNALYRALMETAELVVKAKTESKLLAELCRLLVESELFSRVSIARPDAAGDLKLQWVYGAGGGPSDLLPSPEMAGASAGGAWERAWHEGKLQCDDYATADPLAPPAQSENQPGKRPAEAVVPLFRNGEIWALLTLVCSGHEVFTSELLELLERIGRLAGHGLDALDLRHTLDEERNHQSWLARHDPLTDLLNRRGLTEHVEEAIARSDRQNRSMAIALIDLNEFRTLNELHGHPACDVLLRAVADRLRAALPPSDMAGRLGGDEFVLILEDVDEEKLALLLPEIQAAVEGPIHLPSGRTAIVSTSIGVTMYPRDNSTPEHLLRHADRALYALKESEGETAARWMLFRKEADEQNDVRGKTVLGLFHQGNLRVHYQPLVNLLTGRVTGVEALSRLVDNDGRILPPAEFLRHFGIADLATLTSQVLTQCIKDLHRLDEAGFTLGVGINLDPAILNDPDAVDDLHRQIQTCSLAPHRIVLELLEHTDTHSMNDARATLRDLKARGAKLALDDVGSAYSSLLRMKEFPIDIIKLDRSFLAELDRRPKELKFLMNLVNLAQSLGVDLVAEGVESDASRDALAAMGVNYAQGYAIAKPMAVDDLAEWLQTYQPVPWAKPTTLLGVVALQLIGLDASARVLPQRPDHLAYMQACDADTDCEIGRCMNGLGEMCSQAILAHRAFHAAVAVHASGSNGTVKQSDFQAARLSYEEALFRSVLDAPCAGSA